MSVYALLLCGGSGTRMGAKENKTLLKIGGKVIIREADIQEAKLPDTEGDTGANAPAKIAADGAYRLLSVEHAGDTHGQEWYSRLVCLDVDETAPAGKAVKNG